MRTSGDTAGWPRARRCTSGGHRRHCQNDGGGHRGQGQEGKLAARPAPAGIMMMLLEVSLERSGVSAAPGGRHVDADVPTTTDTDPLSSEPTERKQRASSARRAGRERCGSKHGAGSKSSFDGPRQDQARTPDTDRSGTTNRPQFSIGGIRSSNRFVRLYLRQVSLPTAWERQASATSYETPVSVAQSANDDRKPCGTLPISRSRSSFDSALL